jgi:alpha-1,3-rhamnosyl/mannosyltransferase
VKIAIDARWIFPEISGIGLYTRELLRQFAALETPHEFLALFDGDSLLQRTVDETGIGGSTPVRPLVFPHGLFSAGSQVLLPRWLARQGIRVFHSPNYMIPFLAFPRRRPGRMRCVVTFHDLIPLLFPEFTPHARKTRFYPAFRAIMREAAARADLAITPSASSKEDVLECLPVGDGSCERVVIVPEGVAPGCVPGAGPRPVPPVILYVGRFDPYKNVPVLVEAFARLLRSRGPDAARLRLVGPEDARYPEARQKARELGVEEKIDWAGYLPGAGLLEAYQQAAVFVLPSLYEGFGLPILEAMACGTPVVCGDRGSQPEVAAGAALLVDPTDPGALAEAIGRILSDADLHADLRTKGLERAASYAWRRAAETTCEVYERAAKL